MPYCVYNKTKNYETSNQSPDIRIPDSQLTIYYLNYSKGNLFLGGALFYPRYILLTVQNTFNMKRFNSHSAILMINGFLILFFSTLIALAQETSFIGTSSNPSSTNLEVLNASVEGCGYVATGFTTVSGGLKAACIISIDGDGNQVFDRMFNFTNDRSSIGEDIKATADGGYIITGSIILENLSDVLLIKLDNNGNIVWSTAIGSAGNEGGASLIVVSDGYVITGFGETAEGGKDVIILKTDLNGNLQWDYKYGTISGSP